MRADDLRINELITFADGQLSLQGRRLVIHDLHAFAQFRQDLIAMVGLTQARRILTRFGYFWGQADAAAMQRLFTWDSPEELIKAGPRLHTLQGVVRAMVKSLRFDQAARSFRMEVVWHDSGEAEEHLLAGGETGESVCWMLTGYASGYASYALGYDIYFIEQRCRAQGAKLCTALGQDEKAWGHELKPHLPFFHADDIQGKVRELARELKRTTRDLARQREELARLRPELAPEFAEVHSRAFRQVLEVAWRIAQFDTAVLITGDSGTGKEVIARLIHRHSPRHEKPFIAINCSALPDTLLESELFGHTAGAFTGAGKERLGLFEQAQRGTILLDEIGDISPALQAKLLRVLQEKEIVRVGENLPRKIDVRVLAATNRDLTAAIRDGKFREDLFYRLRVVEIELPPLRARREDILPLARFLVTRLSVKLKLPHLRLSPACLDHLQAYAWPGNVRELENALERAAVMSRDGLIVPENLPRGIIEAALAPSLPGGGIALTLAQLEAQQIQAVLKLTAGHKGRAAARLGISPATLWRKLKHGGTEASTS